MTSKLVGYAPEKCAVLACLDSAHRPAAFAKVFADEESVTRISRLHQEIASGLDPWSAVVNAAVHRTRPVVLTATAEGLLDYVFKAGATAAVRNDTTLLRLFAFLEPPTEGEISRLRLALRLARGRGAGSEFLEVFLGVLVELVSAARAADRVRLALVRDRERGLEVGSVRHVVVHEEVRLPGVREREEGARLRRIGLHEIPVQIEPLPVGVKQENAVGRQIGE